MSFTESGVNKTPKDLLIEGFVKGLKSKNDDLRHKTARDLHHYVTMELQELSVEDINDIMEKFNVKIQSMICHGSDIYEKKGGILAIIVLIGVDVGNRSTRCSRFANYLRNLVPNEGLMELVAYAVARIAVASGTPTNTYVDYEVRRAIEWLSGDRSEPKRHGAVS